MRAISVMTTAIVAILVTGPVQAQSINVGSAVHRPSNQVILGGRIVGEDPDPNVRLEIRRTFDSHGP
jgi:hypothetical protein